MSYDAQSAQQRARNRRNRFEVVGYSFPYKTEPEEGAEAEHNMVLWTRDEEGEVVAEEVDAERTLRMDYEEENTLFPALFEHLMEIKQDFTDDLFELIMGELLSYTLCAVQYCFLSLSLSLSL